MWPHYKIKKLSFEKMGFEQKLKFQTSSSIF